MILLHGLGGAQDLPVPAPLAIAAGTAAVAVTIALLAWAWRTPRYETHGIEGVAPRSSPLEILDSPWWDHALAALGLAIFGWITWALVAGVDGNANPVFGTFYVLVWVGVLPLSLLFGRVARALSPWRTLHRMRCWAMGSVPDEGLLPYPGWLGSWPAALGLYAFVWQELVSTDQVSLGAVQVWIGAYALAMLVGATLFGTTWLDHADPFQVYSDLMAHLSPWHRNALGELELRSPLANLATLRAGPGLLGCMAILFGSTIYDSAKDSPAWTRFVDRITVDPRIVGTLALLAAWAIVGITFVVAARMSQTSTEGDAPARRSLPALLAPSLVPIIAGYMTAHYLSYFVYQGQIALQQLSDPLSTGANYLGTGTIAANLWLNQHPTILATLKVLAIVIGHVVGAVAVHDRALELATGELPDQQPPRTTGLAMSIMMVLYTGTGLMLLFGI